jgi:hypothetical protein
MFKNRKTMKEWFNDTFFTFQTKPSVFIMNEQPIYETKNDDDDDTNNDDEFKKEIDTNKVKEFTNLEKLEYHRSNFYMCKKRNLFSRSSKRSFCAALTPGSEYFISKIGKTILKNLIKIKLRNLIVQNKSKIVQAEEHKRKNSKETLRTWMFGDIQHRILKKSINNFYVRTSLRGQTIGDRSKKYNIPRSTKDTVVFPAALYLNNKDMEDLTDFEDTLIQTIIHPSLSPHSDQNIQPPVTPVENTVVSHVEPPKSLSLESPSIPSESNSPSHTLTPHS